MWVVIYGIHYKYLNHKQYRFETSWSLIAWAVYWFYHCRYSLTVYPVKYVKIFKSEEVIRLSTYSGSYQQKRRGTK